MLDYFKILLCISRHSKIVISFTSGESCDITPVTSVAPPIKPVTPSPGNPPVQTYSVKSGNTDCIVLQAGIEFIIPYTSNGAVGTHIYTCINPRPSEVPISINITRQYNNID